MRLERVETTLWPWEVERHGEKWKTEIRRRKETRSHVFKDLQDTVGLEEMIVDGQLVCVINFSEGKQLIHSRSCSLALTVIIHVGSKS